MNVDRDGEYKNHAVNNNDMYDINTERRRSVVGESMSLTGLPVRILDGQFGPNITYTPHYIVNVYKC